MAASQRRRWSRDELLVAFHLYFILPFGRMSQLNPLIIETAALIDRSPAALAMKLGNIASLDDSITASGRSGLRNASRVDREMWEQMETDWDRFAEQIEDVIQRLGVDRIAETADQPAPEDTEADATTKVRRGQARFRRAVLRAYGERCCLTGLSEPQLLVASHIVPWREDPARRLHPSNGLCLNTLHDRAFDRGLITFDEDMRMMAAPGLVASDDPATRRWFRDLEGSPLRQPIRFRPDQEALAFHREHVFAAQTSLGSER